MKTIIITVCNSYHLIFSKNVFVNIFLFLFSAARPLTKCEKERQKAQQDPAVGTYIPQCTADGSFAPMQVSGSTGYCWCVDNDGNEIPGTLTPPGREMPQCASMHLSYELSAVLEWVFQFFFEKR